MAYSSLSRAQLTYEYLHTNSTTHEFLFGALAELVDNARDADATEMKIYTMSNEKFRGGFVLCFLDNGCGMDPVEVSQVVQFGRSSKREAGANHIGQYGNGLKSGSMRIGKDMILFTKKGEIVSCLFLSRTFHEREDIHEVIVPMPSWNHKTREPFIGENQTLETHNLEVEIITKYSPFNSESEIFAEFDKISEKGTNVMIYNLKLMDNGLPELDINKDPKDIIMADPHSEEVYDIDEHIQPEKMSFRAYCSIIYFEPRMKIYIQDEKVLTKKLIYGLFKPKSYTFTSNRFKKRSEFEAEQAERIAKDAEEKAKELQTQSRETNAKNKQTTAEGRQAIAKAAAKAEEARFDANLKKKVAEAKRKSAKEPKTLTFTFGFNISKRRCDGIFIYNCNRLIKMYQKVGAQLEVGNKCAGLVGIVDVPYLVLEPTHNKQDFADQKEYKHLLRSMSDHMMQYWKDSKIESQGITKFWDDFGYSGSWKDDPSDDAKFKIKRMSSTIQLAQCNDCLKWRQMTFSRKMINYILPPTWVCSNNTDIALSNCNKPEQKINIEVGKLTKDIKNLQDKRAEEVRKLEAKLSQKKSEIKRSRRRSPSPVREPSPSPTQKRGRKQRSPSPPPVKRKTPLKRSQSPSPPPVKITKRRLKSPSPSPPRRGRKVKSPSPPPKLKRKTKSPSPSPKSKRKAKSPSPPPPVQSRPKRISTIPESSPVKPKGKLKKPEPEEKEKIPVKIKKLNDDEIGDEEEEQEELSSSIYPLQCKVEAKMHNSWYSGTVVNYKKSGDKLRVRVKFDKHSHDKFDKWFHETDPTLRQLANSDTNHVNHVKETNVETINKEDYNDPTGELLEKTTYLLRRCLCYFRAPDFEKDKREISSLTPQQLKDFPLSMFFDDYERNIKKQLQETLNRKAEEIERRLRECETEKNRLEKELKEAKQTNTKTGKTLKDLRLDVNVMLRNILNEDEKLDFNDASENVDIYLRTIVEQINDETNKK